MGIMTGAASTSIQISYSTEDGGIATEEIIGFGGSEFLAEVEDVEEYPVNHEQPENVKEYLTDGSKFIKGSIEFELKMVTLITDKNCDGGVRILGPEEEKETTMSSHSPINHVQHVSTCEERKSKTEEEEVERKVPPPIPVVEAPNTDVEFPRQIEIGASSVEIESTKYVESIESCLRESMEICLDNSSSGHLQVAEEILIDHRHERFQVPEEHGGVETFLSDAPQMSDNPQFNPSLTTSFDGPPILSPNYEPSSDSTEPPSFSGDDPPPALTKEFDACNGVPRGRGRPRGRKNLKRKRSPKSPRKSKSRKTGSNANHTHDLQNGKSSTNGHKDAHAQHRSTGPVVIPHSSAEIQERVKNRQRKMTQSYGSSSSVDTNSEVDPGEKPLPKVKPRQRKPSSESSNSSECKGRRGRPQQNGLFIVEKILKKGIINGRPYFFVKWLNYPPSKNTWEPEANFSLDLIAAYERKVAETGQLVKVIEGVNIHQSPPEFRSVMRSTSTKDKKVKCPGCISYPLTFTDNRLGRNGFDEGLTYHKILESFVLEEVRCALVEFDEKHALELIPLEVINEKLKAELKLN